MGNHLSLLSSVSDVIAPSAHDWIVSLWFHDGTFIKRRVSPAKVSWEHAVERAIHSTKRNPSEVRDIEARRFSDISPVIASEDAELRSLIEKARLRNDGNR